ncbi:MAG: M28 family peptidase, partial [Flavisolibacter sp.]
LLLYNSASSGDELSFDNKQSGTSFPLPVFYITRTAKSHFLSDPSATLDIKLTSEIKQKKRSATNVIGYIDNGAPATVIIGAHYDHIGRGEDESSTQVGYKGQIHNGADDNASGVAALMELGRLIKNSSLRNNNYLFIAFSGEELGLFGSKYFTSHPSTDLANVNYMVNMDMVGRLNDSSHVITIGGYGTSPSWGELYNQSGKHKLYSGNLIFHFDSTGTGPSDHTSFYLKDIPVLFFFTGIHSDYHKPTDDYEKINFYGEMMVVKHIYSLIEALDKQKRKLSFLKTRDQQMGQIRFSVTLGIMPDYAFIGQGVRIDAISDNRPAMNAGLKVGDVIIALGDYHFSSLEGYMRALGKFKKGDKTIVIYMRGNQTLSSPIEF